MTHFSVNNTLSNIKFNSKYTITFSQRVKDLYLVLYEFYLEAMDGNEGEKKVAKRSKVKTFVKVR